MVNINDVYQTVLVISNKDNRGYITPEEFNRLADQTQNEIFEAYFKRQAGYEDGFMLQSDFSDPVLNVSEKINTFYKNSDLTKTVNTFLYPNDLRSLGVVSVNGSDADKVSHSEVKYINLSPLTSPVATQPVYTLESTGVRVYPDTITTGVNIDYLKNPIRPKWGYIMPTASQIAAGVPNEPIYDPTVFDPDTDDYNATAKSYNIELHPSEFNQLVVTILGYAGVVIKQGDVTQFAGGKEVQFQQTDQ